MSRSYDTPPPYWAPAPEQAPAWAPAPEQAEEGLVPVGGSSFADKAVRLAFIRKVYAILTAQLVLTMAFIGLFFIPAVKEFVKAHSWLVWVAFALTFLLIIVLACVPDVSRKSPQNLLLLWLLTCCIGFTLGTITAHYEVEEVLLAVGLTAAVVLALTLFAFQTRIDFTMWGGVLLCVLVVFCLASLVALFFPLTRTLRLLYAGIGAVILSVFIVYDTQLLIGGNHKYSLGPEEYVFAALNLYLDIVNLFSYLLMIIGVSGDGGD